ncbi:His-Xaa-Ser system radical SAM maturase HxsB [Brevundimonas diminuta]|uniref:His-Xaa-Ser system radical SAM maturase HxsB n=1 Tax=Brevundimonas diminuta TaxID=293 RepID=UPI0032085C87
MRRSIQLDAERRRVLVTNDFGDYAVLSSAEHNALTADALLLGQPRHADLEARALLLDTPREHWSDLESAAYATRKSFALDGPSLHIFVVTLRCDHSCQYCQVSRAAVDAAGFDMSLDDAYAAVDRVFEAPAPALTIEFQGGEPALRFDLVRTIVERAEALNEIHERKLSFAMVSTLHHLSDDDLAYCRDHEIRLSTSIDGPADWHDANRPNPGRDSWARTLHALARARAILGDDAVSALPTLTRRALSDPKRLVDHYRDLGFPSIFLRPISPYGFALKTRRAIGYEMNEFLAFYEAALDYILELNASGEPFEETYTAILLRHMLTPFHSGYMDLRSPAGAGLGVLVYDYDGRVYPADEARMAARTGDDRFAMGRVTDSLDTLMSSPAMRWLATGSVAETLPGCDTCAFVPFCGADPVYHAAAHGDPIGDRAASEFCFKHKSLFTLLFNRLADADASTLTTFLAWAMGKPRGDILAPGHVDR